MLFGSGYCLRAATDGLLGLLAPTSFEFFGTHQGGWHYNKSLWFVTGTIPVELLVLFFCCGVWMAALHLIFRSHTVVPLAVAGSVLLAVAVYGLVVRHTVLNLPLRFGAFASLDSEPKRSSTILLATATALADWLVETWAIGAGNYAYAEVFTYEIPLSYAMLVMGFVGLLGERCQRAAARTQGMNGLWKEESVGFTPGQPADHA